MKPQSTSDEWTQKLVALIGFALLAAAMWSAARIGSSRVYSEYAIATGALNAAETATALNPSDPQAHYARAAALADRGRFDEAITAFEQAIKFSPRDYYLWLRLGRAHDWAGHEAEARQAFGLAIQLAPFYAPPHWELGNLLLRAGEREAAFNELRRAVESNAALLPAVIDLAWVAYEGDAAQMRQAIGSPTAETRLALARYFRKQGRLADTLQSLREAGNEAATTERRTLLRELLEQHRYGEAYQVWLNERGAEVGGNEQAAGLSDGGFEEPFVRDPEAGFGWQLGEGMEAGVKAALDPNSPHAGARSLRLEWAGDLPPALPVISQLMVVEPGRHYRLSFAARTEDLVSGGLPFVAVLDAGQGGSLLGQSATLPRDTGGWREYAIEFVARETTRAVGIVLRRQCETSPCPIYGHLWLDDFSLQQMSAVVGTGQVKSGTREALAEGLKK